MIGLPELAVYSAAFMIIYMGHLKGSASLLLIQFIIEMIQSNSVTDVLRTRHGHLMRGRPFKSPWYIKDKKRSVLVQCT